jgi:hypothetical protein
MKPIVIPKLIISLLLGALLGGLPAAAATSPLEGKKVLLVTMLTGKFRATDDNIKKHLESKGLVVTMVDQAEPASRANGQDLVLISAVVASKVIEGKYKDTPVGVMIWESNILDDMRMTGMHQYVDFDEDAKEESTYIWLANAPHPLQAGLPSGLTNPFTKTQKILQWGKPGVGANIIATLPGEMGKACIFGYEKGATMDYDFIAPARRVMFFMFDDGFDFLNEKGLKLFDAAVTWTAGSAP